MVDTPQIPGSNSVSTTEEEQSASDLIAQFLNDKDSTDTLAVASEEGNNLATEGFGRDLDTMTYAQLNAKYGFEVASNREKLRQSQLDLSKHNAAGSSLYDKARDSALDAAATVYGVSGNTVGALAVRPLAKVAGVDPDVASVALTELTNALVEETRSNRSEYAQNNSRIAAIRQSLDTLDNETEIKQDLDEGQSPMWAGMRLAGKNFLDGVENTVNDPEQIREIVAGSLGSLAPSAAIARASSVAAAKGATLLGASARATTMAQTAAIAAAVGATEASGTYAETMTKIMETEEAVLQQSPIYSGLLQEGYSPEEARIQLANLTAEQAFVTQLPVATALGLLVSKFESAPVGSFRGAGIVGGLRGMMLQGIEETGQSASGQLSQNYAVQTNADASQSLSEGVGEQAAAGLIGGLGQAGVAAAPATLVGGAEGAARIAVKALTGGEQTTVDPETGAETTTNRGQRLAESIGSAVTAPADVVSSLVQETSNRVTNYVSDIAEGVTNETTNENIQLLQEVEANIQTEVNQGNTSPELQKVAVEVDTTPAPEGFERGTVIQNVSQALNMMADKKIRMTDAQKSYAGEQLVLLSNSAASLPKSAKAGVQKLVQSPEAKRLIKALKTKDLSKEPVVTEVTPDVVSETVSVAKVNPTNLNPDSEGVILEAAGDQISEQDLPLVQSAFKISRAISDRISNEIKINTDRNVSLEAKEMPLRSSDVVDADSVSRSIQAVGYTDKAGNKLRSVNDFASEIFQAAQSPDGIYVDDRGRATPVDRIMKQFGFFLEHMNNKVGALNESYTRNNERGVGPTLPFRSLVNASRFIEPTDKDASTVFYHRANPRSVHTARMVAADLNTAAEVYNIIRETFPDRFGSLPEFVPLELLQDVGGSVEASEIQNEQALEQEAQEAENTIQEVTENAELSDNPDASSDVVSDDTASEVSGVEPTEVVEETGTSEPTSEVISSYLTDKEELLPLEDKKVAISKIKEIIHNFFSENVAEFVLESINEFAITYDNEVDGFVYTQGGTALIGFHHNIMMNLLNADTLSKGELHTVLHEVGHVFERLFLEDTITDDFLIKNAWNESDDFVKEAQGYVSRNSENKNELADFLTSYALSRNSNYSIKTELFAEMFALATKDLERLKNELPLIAKFFEDFFEKIETGVETSFGPSKPRQKSSLVTGENNSEDPVQELSKVDLDVSETQAVERKVHESFGKAYQDSDVQPEIKTLDEYFERAEQSGVMNPAVVSMAKRLIRPLVKGMEKRLADPSFDETIEGKKDHLLDHLADGKIQTIRRYRNTALVDPETGKYDKDLIELAGLAFVDWMVSAQATDPNQIDDTMERVGLSAADITEESDMQALYYGIPPNRVKEELASQILRMWGVRPNPDGSLGEVAGIAEGIASEMLTTVANNRNISLLKISQFPVLVGGEIQYTQTIMVDGLRPFQDAVKESKFEGSKQHARELMFGDPTDTFSIGQKLPSVAQTQNRSKLKLSDRVKRALQRMQDTPHYKDEGRVELFTAVGGDNIARILGYDFNFDEITHPVLRNSVFGKNLSIRKNIEDSYTVIEKLSDGETPVYYPVGVTKVGRHQYQGINPQSNKVLRALVSPTWSNLSFNSEKDMEAFWLGVAQASDLYKVEKNNHQDILSEVQTKFEERYGEAKNMVSEWLRTGEMDGAAFADAMGVVEPQQIAAVHAVAEMEFYREQGQETFDTSLSFELDGLTNGAANMMVNYRQGKVTPYQLSNLNRIGLFLGRAGKTVNQYFSARDSEGNRNLDLYESVAKVAQEYMYRRSKEPLVQAAANFALHFGDFERKGEDIVMTRNSAKNPMTKVNYGSGVQGVGVGVADDMVMEFYRRIQDAPEGANLEEYFGYPGMYSDIKALFGMDLNQGINKNFVFPAEAIGVRDPNTGAYISGFRKNISDTIGEILTQSTKDVLGQEITELNDMLVFSTNVQAQYLRQMFQKDLEKLAELRASEGKIRRTAKGKPVMADLSRRDYNSLVKKYEGLSPIFASEDQTLAVGGFDKQLSNLVLSSNMKEELNQKANLPMPGEVGVRAIPFSIIGTGDAMMMNLIFGSDEVLPDVLGIFDGLDVPVGKVKDYASFVNEKVMDTWERDVLAMAVQNFENFLQKAEDEKELSIAFDIVKKKSSKSSVSALDSDFLLKDMKDRHLLNKAWKAALKETTVSVDQMGGSDVGYTRGEQEVSLSEFNERVEYHYNRLLGAPTEEIQTSAEPVELTRYDVASVLGSLKLNSEDSRVVAALQDNLEGVSIVIGSAADMSQYRKENFPDDGLILSKRAKGQFDSANNILFINEKHKSREVILHEMVHAATYSKVLEHYNGNTNDAVTRMEALMNEFLETDFQGPNIATAKTAILKNATRTDAVGKAAALNEFMAYALTNTSVKTALKGKETSLVQSLSKKVVALMRRLLGGVPASMYDHVVFNTEVLFGEPVDLGEDSSGGGDNNGNGTGGDGTTPEAKKFVNHWVKMLQEKVLQHNREAKELKRSMRPIRTYHDQAEAVLDGFRQVGMLSNPADRDVFKAIYMMLAAGEDMNSQATIALTRVFEHIEENITPEMFGNTPEANQEYSAVLNSFGDFKNKEGISDSIGVLLALSQTSQKFRKVLEQIPDPEGNAQVEAGLSGFLTKYAEFALQKSMGAVNTDGKGVSEILDNLSQSIIKMDQEREFRGLQHVTSSLDAADQFTSGMLSELSNWVRDANEKSKQETRSKFKSIVFNTVTGVTNLLDKENSAQTADVAKRATHMNVPFLSLVPVRELVADVIGSDRVNSDVVSMLAVVKSKISGMRQNYREDVPKILEDLFTEAPSSEQWASMYEVLGQSDITAYLDTDNLQNSMALLEQSGKRKQRISELEKALDSNMSTSSSTDAKAKAMQLAGYMRGEGAGKLLMRNAYAIAYNLEGTFDTESMAEVLDELVSLYMIDGMNPQTLETTIQLWQNDPKAIRGIITYIQGLNQEEDNKKGITLQARLNAYKGYLPNEGLKDTRVTVGLSANENYYKARGYIKLRPYEGYTGSQYELSYYVTNTKQGGNYTQGVAQNVQATYRGVDINTGASIKGNVSEFTQDPETVYEILQEINKTDEADLDPDDAMLPVFGVDGEILGFETGMDQSLLDQYLEPEKNLAMMLGAWAGRHVEEALAAQYNYELVDQLHNIWEQREKGTDDLFVNLKKTDDKIYAEAFRVLPQGTKNYIDQVFGKEEFWVRKDMVNLSAGYREFSVADMWSGKTRLPKEVQHAVRAVSQLFFKDKAMRYLTNAETAVQGAVSSAKDMILIRSLIVPSANLKSNVIHLAAIGVPMKQVTKAFPAKLAEIEEYNKNLMKMIRLKAELDLAGRNKNQRRIIESKIQVIEDLNKRMSIYPAIEAGAYTQLSEGMTEMDVNIRSGQINDYLEAVADRIPGRAGDLAHLGLVSKSTKIYKVANRATQYGDFLAKSIYYDHLISQGLSDQEAIAAMNEEFVNFAVPPGRTRSAMEGYGFLWFMSFKLKIMKIAMKQLRDNPVRAFAVNGLLPDVGTPVQDNILTLAAEDRLGYSIGYEMLFGAPEMNPWVNLLDG